MRTREDGEEGGSINIEYFGKRAEGPKKGKLNAIKATDHRIEV